MKSIKEYIIEGLFDNEDDLLDKKSSQEILEWFDNYNNIIINQRFLKILDNGTVSLTQKVDVCWYKRLPEYIKLDKESWEKYATNTIAFELKTQRDIEGIYGNIQEICNAEYLQNINIHTDSVLSFRASIKDYKNITLIGDNYKILRLGIYNTIKDPGQLLQFNYKNIKFVHLICYGLDDLFLNYKKYADLLNGLINKGVVMITFYNKNSRKSMIAAYMVKGTRRWNINKVTKDHSKGEWLLFTDDRDFISILENYY